MYDYFPHQNVVLKSVTAEASGAVLGLSNLSKQHARQLISSHFTTQFTVSPGQPHLTKSRVKNWREIQIWRQVYNAIFTHRSSVVAAPAVAPVP